MRRYEIAVKDTVPGAPIVRIRMTDGALASEKFFSLEGVPLEHAQQMAYAMARALEDLERPSR